MLQVFEIDAGSHLDMDSDVVIGGIFMQRQANTTAAVALDALGKTLLANMYGSDWPSTVASAQFFNCRIPLKKGTRIYNVSDAASAYFYLA